uniref:Chitin-binding type-2 domain-containing protein n=1 Tax=Anopheles atroparvus TaxID=41427 RepID=A0A182IV96_ANOAO
MSRLYPAIVPVLVLSLLLASAQESEPQDDCLEATRPHSSRCDQYFRCKVLVDGTHAWVAAQCQKGLVYMQNLGTCVVPDSDWECDFSTENEHSEENVYGIDNLNGVSTGDIQNAAVVPNEGRKQPQDNAVQSNDSSLELNEIESSGDGNADQLEGPKVQVEKKPYNLVTKPPTKSPSGILSQQQLDSFLAFYDAQSDLKSKTKRPPLDEQNHLAHLKQIVKQQNQLNRMGNQFKDASFLWPKPVALSEQTTPRPSESDPNKDTATVKIPPGMEDIIRSILQISQQAIANQKSSAATAPAEPVVKPILIPISLNTIQPSTRSSADPVAAAHDRMKTKTTVTNNGTPVQMGLHGSFNVDRNTVYNAFREQPINQSLIYDPPQQMLYDAFGNRFVPKDAYQMLPQNAPHYAYNSFAGLDRTSPQIGRPAAPMVSNSWTPFGATQQQQPQSAPELTLYQQNQPRPISSPPSTTSDTYDKLRGIIERIDQLSAIESSEQFENDDHGSESEASDDDDPTDSAQNSDEDGPPGVASSKLKRKLFTLGDATFDYDQYKDSMLPLVEANPNDDRISVVTCMVGSRQPNRTDCLRYYICNPHNGVFQSYTCPKFTAFNKHSRMCDMASYKPCKAKTSTPTTPRPRMKQKKGSSSPSDLSQLKSELRTAQRYVELIRAEAEKLRLHGSLQTQPTQKIIFLPSMDFSNAGGASLSKTQRKPSSGKRKPVRRVTTPVVPITKKTKPTVPRCRLDGRMPDPMDRTNYFVCHRKSPKKFIKLKMACPGNLIYCAASQYCTAATNC